ncbi:MAG: VOC family protein [Candidatus Heimdallarchaeota archaeon]
MTFNSQISFLYYKDVKKASEFYEKIFNFELSVDQGWAKIYKVVDGAYLSLVDETRGHFNWQKDKTVMITLVTSTKEEVDEWYEKLRTFNVKFLSEPKNYDEIIYVASFLRIPKDM